MIPAYIRNSIARAFDKRLEPIDVLRHSAGYYDSNGFWVQAGPTTVQILADVQPITGEDLQRISDGRDLKDVVSIWTIDVLRGLDSGSKVQPDQITYDGKQYEVEGVQVWDSHVEAVGIRIQDA